MTFLLVCALQISVILLMALLAQSFLRNMSAAARHWVLSAAVVFSATVPLLNTLMPSWSVPEAITRYPAIVPIQKRLSAITLPSPPSAESSTIAAKSNAPLEHSARANTFRRFIAAVWLGGILVGLMVLITGLVRLARLAAASRAIRHGPWIELTQQISKEYRLRLTVNLLMSRNSSVLVTFGLLRPKLILPAGAMEWPADRARIVLRHELAHIRRSDWLVQMIAQCLRIVYWFNPLVWIVCNRLRLESECACDNAVVAAGTEGHEYATHLLHLARTLNRTDRAWSGAMTMSCPSTIERRFSAILNPVLNRRPVTRTIMFVTILTGFAVMLPLTMLSTAKEVHPVSIIETHALPAPAAMPQRTEAPSQPTPQPRPQTVPRPTLQPAPQRATVPPPPSFSQLANLLNPGFEDGLVGGVGEAPEGWRFGSNGGYFSMTTRNSCYSGTQCAMVQSTGSHAPDQKAFLFQIVEASPLRGKQFRFRAAVRAKVAGPDGARLLVRIHRPDGSSCFFDNMADRPITSEEWALYEITGNVCPDAVDLELGMQLWGDGSAWMDDASLSFTK